MIQRSRTDELARSLVEPQISVVNGRYEIPVPFKTEMLKKLPDNYDGAIKHPESVSLWLQGPAFLVSEILYQLDW